MNQKRNSIESSVWTNVKALPSTLPKNDFQELMDRILIETTTVFGGRPLYGKLLLPLYTSSSRRDTQRQTLFSHTQKSMP